MYRGMEHIQRGGACLEVWAIYRGVGSYIEGWSMFS